MAATIRCDLVKNLGLLSEITQYMATVGLNRSVFRMAAHGSHSDVNAALRCDLVKNLVLLVARGSPKRRPSSRNSAIAPSTR